MARYALIGFNDEVLFECNDLARIYGIFCKNCDSSPIPIRGIFDYQVGSLLDIVDIIDRLGCQVHSF